MYCHKCGSPLPEGANFCSVCGANVKDTAKTPVNITSPPDAESTTPDKTKVKRAKPPKPPKAKKVKVPGKASGKKAAKIAVISVAAFLILVIAAAVTGYFVVNSRYQDALAVMGNKPAEAKEQFMSISWYKDSSELAESCQKAIDYGDALTLMKSGDYMGAKEMFLQLGSYGDSVSYAEECQKNWDYDYLVALMDRGQYQQALDGFTELGKFKDSVELAVECLNAVRYEQAVSLMDEGSYEEAKEVFDELGEYADSGDRAGECQDYLTYFMAEDELHAGNNFDAYMLFGSIRDFSDAAQRQEKCIVDMPPASELSRNPDFASKGCDVTIIAPREELMVHTYMKVYSENGELVTTLFIPRGEKLKIVLPPGSYTFKTGYGWDWFGEKDAFGQSGEYSTLLFDGGSETWKISSGYSYTLTLLPEGSGNIGGRDEDLGDF